MIIQNCPECGRGTIVAKVGYANCNYCGTIVARWWETTFSNLGQGEEFVFADDHPANYTVYRKISENEAISTEGNSRARVGPLASVVSMRDIEMVQYRHNEKKHALQMSFQNLE